MRSIGEIVGRSVGSLGPASEFQLAALTNEQLVARAIENTNLLIGYLGTLASESPTRSVTVTFGGPIIGYRVLNGGPIYVVFSELSVTYDLSNGVCIQARRHQDEAYQEYILHGQKKLNLYSDSIEVGFRVPPFTLDVESLLARWKEGILKSCGLNTGHVNGGARFSMPPQGGTVADARDFV